MNKKPFSMSSLSKLCLAMGLMLSAGAGYAYANPTEAPQVRNESGTFTANGVVVDEKGEPIIGATVLVSGTNLGTATDVDGRFSLKGVKPNAKLQVSYVGFNTETVAANPNGVTVTLSATSENLDEVVVVGYSTQKKVNLTGAVQSLNSKQLTQRNVASASQALQGLMPGVNVYQTSGAPGATAAIQIRGNGSINSSGSPLILIDGLEGDMNSIDMNAIESISVLKDAASAAIYGSKASNGVILVTTKRAENTNATVTYNGWVGFRQATNMPTPANAVQYMEYMNLANHNAGSTNDLFSQDLINTYKTEGADNINRYDTDWMGELYKKSMLTHNHSVSVSGGGKSLRTFINASYNFEDGLIPNHDNTRMALRSNTDANITSWLRAGLNLNLRRTTQNAPVYGANAIIGYCLTMSPIYGAYNADGTWADGQNGINPVAYALAGGASKSDNNDLDVKGTLIANPLDGLEILASYSTRHYEYKGDSFTDTYDTYANGSKVQTIPTTGNSRSEGWSRLIRNQFNAQASYEKTFAEAHYLKALVGFETIEVKNKSFGGARTNFKYPGFQQMNNGTAATATNYGGWSEVSQVSYIARLNYIYGGKYMVELTGRYDGTSRFTPENRWGFFPAASVGYRISEESYFEGAREYVNNLKLRASYGLLGNQEIGNYYPYASTLVAGGNYWAGGNYAAGILASQMPNANISWEKSKQFNVGLDASAFNSRLNVTFDYYIRNISDLLQVFPAPLYVALSAPWMNAGDMRNNGWDLAVTWNDRIGKVDYSVTAMLSDVKNTITDLKGNKYINSNNSTQEGHPIYSWYGYVADGYFQNQSEIDNAPCVYGGNKANVKPGYIRYKDINEDGVINDQDRTFLGDPQNRYNFSLNLSANWNGFDANLFFQGVGKRDIYAEGYGVHPFKVGRSILTSQFDTWTPENPNAEYPLLLIEAVNGANPNNIPSSFWVKSGAYMRLKNATIGYTLPKNIIRKAGIDNLRFYVSGQNLFTICNAYKGYDPEGSVGTSYYPLMRIYTFGIDIKF